MKLSRNFFVYVSIMQLIFFLFANAAISKNSWNPIGDGIGASGDDIFGYGVECVAEDNSNNIYAGGNFLTAGGVSAKNIAQWNGVKWSALGVGITGENATVWTLAVDFQGNLYVGGQFSFAGGVRVNNIAMWDGTSWSNLGDGLSNTSNYPARVRALTFDNAGNLYAGGMFDNAGGVFANNIAMWDGTNWHAVGHGFSGDVKAIVIGEDGGIYAGGGFTPGIAKWDGSTWNSLGEGVAPADEDDFATVIAMAFDNAGNLLVGGYFQLAGAVPANGIAKWDGAGWSALGEGISGGYPAVYAISFDRTGNLFVGGGFAQAGNSSAQGIAFWNGKIWRSLGVGVGGVDYPSVNSLLTDSAGSLLVGGKFTLAGGNPANHIAMYSRSSVPGYYLAVKSTGATWVSITANPSIYAGTTNYTKTNISNGTSITLTAPATSGSTRFSSWTGCDSTNAANRTCSVTMSGNKTVTSQYEEGTLPGVMMLLLDE